MLVAGATVVATVPSARISDRIGRKPVIYTSCVLGSIGMAVVAAAPVVQLALPGAVLVGLAVGTFLSVDWALMTDIIPKASSGRYMGLSNVATATNGVFATLLGGIVIDAFYAAGMPAAGPRVAFLLAILWFAMGALMLWPVKEPLREERRQLALAD